MQMTTPARCEPGFPPRQRCFLLLVIDSVDPIGRGIYARHYSGSLLVCPNNCNPVGKKKSTVRKTSLYMERGHRGQLLRGRIYVMNVITMLSVIHRCI